MIAISASDARYPGRLRDLERPPDPLWVDGDVTAINAMCVAIVGTRRMTGYGERVSRELAMACASAGMVVVSGFAQGIDSSAHRGALDGGGRTVAVLGESIATFVATLRGRRRPLLPRIRASGALVSEFAAPFTARPWTFVQRDATIAALASVVVVVEAGESSGALITAQDARRLGRRLYAVPGPLGSIASVGTNALIARGLAAALVSTDQLVRAAGATQRSVTAGARVGAPGDAVGATREAGVSPAATAGDPVLEALRDGPLGLDELARRLRIPTATLSMRVAMLVMRGALGAEPDGRISRR